MDVQTYTPELLAQKIREERIVHGGFSPTYQAIIKLDWKHEPVPPETFLTDPYYLGKFGKSLYDKWMEDLCYVLDPKNNIQEHIMCLAGNTRIPLLDGSNPTIAELHENWCGPTWVYSVDSSRQMVPGYCTGVHCSGEDELYRVWLDDGSYLEANSRHELVLSNGRKRMVSDLRTGDSLMPFHTRLNSTGYIKDYEQVWDPASGKYIYTHYMSARWKYGSFRLSGVRSVYHHKNYRKLDNSPSNLELAEWNWHQDYHSRKRRAYLAANPEVLESLSERQSAVCSDPSSPIRVANSEYMNSDVGRDLARSNLGDLLGRGIPKEAALRGTLNRWSDPQQVVEASARTVDLNERGIIGCDTWTEESRAKHAIAMKKATTARNSTEERVCPLCGDTFIGLNKYATHRRWHCPGQLNNHNVVKVERTGRKERVYCLTVEGTHNFAISTSERGNGVISGNTGAIGLGKSTAAAMELCYKLYRLSCLRTPAEYYGLMASSPVVMGVYNVFKYKADDNYSLIKTFIEESPYFKKHFPTKKMEDRKMADGLHFQNNVHLVTGANQLHAIGQNLMSLLIDEMNFMRVPDAKQTQGTTQANDLYYAAKRRLSSRFLYRGNIPGIIVLLSSRNAETSWLEQHLEDSHDKPEVFVSDYAVWDVKPKHIYCGMTFRVEVGDELHSSRILSKEDIARPGAQIIDVPVEHQDDFNTDVEGALRDVAGVASLSFLPFIRQREKIRTCLTKDIKHPFTKEQFVITTEDEIQIKDYHLPKMVSEVKWSNRRPLLNPTAPRHVHVDLSENQDSTGICMAHIDDIEGQHPQIIVDFQLRLVAPKSGMIEYAKIRSFLVYLRDDVGFPIKWVTFDRFQSTDSRQILSKLGFDTALLSVDKKDEAYLTFRQVLYEGGLRMYEYTPCIQELIKLQHNVVKKKVDHPKHGSKDTADALAACVFALCVHIGKDKGLRKAGSEKMTPIPDYGKYSSIADHAALAQTIVSTRTLTGA